MNMNKNSSKLMGHSEGNPEREVHSNSSLPKENRKKISNKQPNPTSKKTRGTTTNKAERRRNQIIKIRAELNNIETKTTIQNL